MDMRCGGLEFSDFKRAIGMLRYLDEKGMLYCHLRMENWIGLLRTLSIAIYMWSRNGLDSRHKLKLDVKGMRFCDSTVQLL